MARNGKELLMAQDKARADGKFEEFLDSLSPAEIEALSDAEDRQYADYLSQKRQEWEDSPA